MSRTVFLALWALSAAMVVLCVVISLAGRRVATPRQVGTVVTSSAPRLAFAMLCWAWLGWHFFAR